MSEPPRSKRPPHQKGTRPSPSAASRKGPRPHDTSISPKAQSKGRLAPEWMDELRNTVRPGRLEQTAALVLKALEGFWSGDFERAANLAAQAKEQAQRSGRVRELAGLALYRGGSYRDAVRELLTYRRFSGRLDQNHVIADCYRALGRPDRALEICHEVTPDRVTPEVWAEVLIVAASILADQGDLEKALAQTDRAERTPPRVETYHLRLWYVRADLLEKTGRRKEAKTLWERISALDPNFFDVGERLRV